MKLRRADIDDAGKLSLVGMASFLETFAHDHDGDQIVRYLAEQQSPAWYTDRLARPDVAAWLIEEVAGAPVGYAVACAAELPGASEPGDYELKRIYVLSKWQGNQLGSQLYDRVEAYARQRGAARLALSVYVTNHGAQRFYAARGFEIIGRWLFEGFDASEDFIAVKRL